MACVIRRPKGFEDLNFQRLATTTSSVVQSNRKFAQRRRIGRHMSAPEGAGPNVSATVENSANLPEGTPISEGDSGSSVAVQEQPKLCLNDVLNQTKAVMEHMERLHTVLFAHPGVCEGGMENTLERRCDTKSSALQMPESKSSDSRLQEDIEDEIRQNTSAWSGGCKSDRVHEGEKIVEEKQSLGVATENIQAITRTSDNWSTEGGVFNSGEKAVIPARKFMTSTRKRFELGKFGASHLLALTNAAFQLLREIGEGMNALFQEYGYFPYDDVRHLLDNIENFLTKLNIPEVCLESQNDRACDRESPPRGQLRLSNAAGDEKNNDSSEQGSSRVLKAGRFRRSISNFSNRIQIASKKFPYSRRTKAYAVDQQEGVSGTPSGTPVSLET